MTSALPGTTVIPYTVHDGSAKNGVDYNASNGSVFLAQGQTTAQISVPIVRDAERGVLVLEVAADEGDGGGVAVPATGLHAEPDADPWRIDRDADKHRHEDANRQQYADDHAYSNGRLAMPASRIQMARRRRTWTSAR